MFIAIKEFSIKCIEMSGNKPSIGTPILSENCQFLFNMESVELSHVSTVSDIISDDIL